MSVLPAELTAFHPWEPRALVIQDQLGLNRLSQTHTNTKGKHRKETLKPLYTILLVSHVFL